MSPSLPDGPEDASSSATRRRFLQALTGLGAAVTGTIISKQAADLVEAATPEVAGDHSSMNPQVAVPKPSGGQAEGAHQWAFVVDLRRCDGCEMCTRECQKAHYLTKNQTWIKVYKITTHTGQMRFMPRLCMHCEAAPCVKVCPVAATFKNEEGVVLVNQSTCIGCRTCMAACPYEARYFNWDDPPPAPNLLENPMPEFPVPQQKGTVGKCILCVHNTEMGKLPVCVEACVMGALYIGDLKADVATNGRETVKLSKFLKENDAERFREELGTRPRLWYIQGHGQKLGL